MAISKITLNGVTQIDVTQKTVAPGSMLNGITALKNDGTDITGTIASKSSTDLTASGATVTVPAGYYAEAASKSVSSMTLPTSAAASATSGFTSKATISRSTSDQYINIPTGYNSAGAYYKVSAVANGSATTPATAITANPSISVSSGGLITASTSVSQSVTPTVSAGYISSGTSGTVTVSGSNTQQLSTQAGTTITPTESEQTAVASGKYTTGAVKVGAISSTYVGSDISQNDSDDLTVSGATVTALAGYYAEAASKSVASGTEGTPVATKGTVSNNQVTVTPSVTNTAGYISGSTKTGTAVTVSASELVSGTKTITASGTTDVTNYASASVSAQSLPTSASASAASGYTSKATISRSTSDQYINIPTGYNAAGAYYKVSAVPDGTAGTPTATKGAVSGNSVSVTPSVTNTTGYITGGTKTGTAVTVSASELVSGTKTISAAGTTDVTNYASASVAAGGVSIPSNSYDMSNATSISVDSDGLVSASASFGFSPSPSVASGYITSNDVTVGAQSVSISKTYQLTTQEKMVAEANASGDILAGLTTQYYYTMRAIDLVPGQWSYNTPADTPTTRARSKDFVYVTAGSSISYVNNSYDCYFQVYGSKTSSTISQNIGWKTDASGTINITVDGYLTFIVRNHYNTSADVNPQLWDGSVAITYAGSHNGVNWTWEGSNTCVVSGTCNSSSGAVSNLITNTAIPSSIVPGDTYYVSFNSSPAQSNARFRIIFYDSNGDMLTPTYYCSESRYFVVPTGATNWTVGLHSANVTYSSSVTLTGMNIYAVKKIVDAGVYTTGDIFVSGYSALASADSGPSNYVTGTFTGTTTGTAMDVPIPYTGDGYPVAVMIYPTEGPYNSGTGTIYSLIQNKAVIFCSIVKDETDTVPDYSTNGYKNTATFMITYKASTSSSSSTTTAGSLTARAYYNYNASRTTQTDIVKIKDSTTLSVYIASPSYTGFVANVEYTYQVIYSS